MKNVLIIGLGRFGEKFKVEVDEREAAIREALPGNNCGGCGYPGCDGCAKAINEGNAPVNACPVGQKPCWDAIAAILGVTAGESEKKVAFVKCKGDCHVTKNQANYIGMQDCRSAMLAGVAISAILSAGSDLKTQRRFRVRSSTASCGM